MGEGDGDAVGKNVPFKCCPFSIEVEPMKHDVKILPCNSGTLLNYFAQFYSRINPYIPKELIGDLCSDY